jgi:3'-5' exoribonuclease 1
MVPPPSAAAIQQQQQQLNAMALMLFGPSSASASLGDASGGGGGMNLQPAFAASSTSPMPAPSLPYDYLLVLDFEATCEEPTPPNYLHEIIEFPVVVVEVSSCRVVAEFHSFVRPVANPVLSAFCTRLTGITQKDVDSAPLLQDVIKQFESWQRHTIPASARVVFATDGPWDMKEFMFLHSVKRRNIHFPQIFYTFIDVKLAFANFFRCSRGKIKAMLDYLGLPLKGRLHSGLDDSRNVANIVIGLLIRGCNFTDAIERIAYIGPPVSIDAEGH